MRCLRTRVAATIRGGWWHSGVGDHQYLAKLRHCSLVIALLRHALFYRPWQPLTAHRKSAPPARFFNARVNYSLISHLASTTRGGAGMHAKMIKELAPAGYDPRHIEVIMWLRNLRLTDCRGAISRKRSGLSF